MRERRGECGEFQLSIYCFPFPAVWIKSPALSAASLVRCCDWMRQYGHFSNDTLVLLDQMGGQMTQQECPVSFPERFYKEQKNAKVDSRIVFIRDSLKLIMDLYRHGDMSTVTWDTNKFEQFMVTMHRQMDELNNCVSTTSKADRRLTRYYRKLRRTLYKEGSSSVSLELIRKETKRHLQMLDLLMVNTSQRVSAGSQ